MSSADFPENVRKLIYESIDSVSMLEALIIISQSKERSWSAESLSLEMRSNPNSAANCLAHLTRIGVAEEDAKNQGEYRYAPKSKELAEAVAALPDLYQSMRHRMLELIFSPLKQARIISNGLRISSKKRKRGDDNG